MSVHLKSGIIWGAFYGRDLIRWVASLEGNNLVVFYYLKSGLILWVAF
jgi:hypothetical protein